MTGESISTKMRETYFLVVAVTGAKGAGARAIRVPERTMRRLRKADEDFAAREDDALARFKRKRSSAKSAR